MTPSLLHPLRFAPIYQYRLWGGRRLANWLTAALPDDGPVGEAWLLSDRDDHPSRVAEGPFKGDTIAQLLERSAEHIFGRLSPRFSRFPLLLKFLDVSGMLSVQVHPSDAKSELIPPGETGKTEAWVVLEAAPGSRVYAGLRAGTSLTDLRSLSQQTVNDRLASFSPRRGQGLLIEAGVVHALGDGVVVFEVQENSDVTFRLYDWDHIDPRTDHPRALQVEQALACVDFAQGPVVPAAEAIQPGLREKLFDCSHFLLWRLQSAEPFSVGTAGAPRVLVCIDGTGHIEYANSDYVMEKGAVILMPAVVGACRFRPAGPVTLLEIAVPETP